MLVDPPQQTIMPKPLIMFSFFLNFLAFFFITVSEPFKLLFFYLYFHFLSEKRLKIIFNSEDKKTESMKRILMYFCRCNNVADPHTDVM